jgi:hypothetical protein
MSLSPLPACGPSHSPFGPQADGHWARREPAPHGEPAAEDLEPYLVSVVSRPELWKPWANDPESFERAVLVVAELGLPRTRFHDLRHAHATQLLSAGVHVKAVSERLGHSSKSFTMAPTRP